MNEAEVEQEIQDKNLNAPRITPERINSLIEKAEYWVVPNSTTTVCAIKLYNGFVVVGHSACASVDNFNADLGAKIAFGDAREKIWQLEGYALRCMLAANEG